MGQKTNSNLFRLVSNNKQLSSWFSSKNSYAKKAFEDYAVRNYIDKFFEDIFVISHIKISRQFSSALEIVNVQINVLTPEIEELRSLISKFILKKQRWNINTYEDVKIKNTKELSTVEHDDLNVNILIKLVQFELKSIIRKFKQLNNKKVYSIKFNFIDSVYSDSSLLAQHICKQLKNRISFNKILNETSDQLLGENIKGAKIEVSGRLNGSEIARTEWKLIGDLPLQTLSANIKYAAKQINTIYGVYGVKVWLFFN